MPKEKPPAEPEPAPPALRPTKPLVLHSGGIDSTVCLALYRHEGLPATALLCDYGQPALPAEERASLLTAASMGAIHDILRLPTIPKALGSDAFPGRNLLLIAAACAYALAHEHDEIAIGSTASDAEFPDSRPLFLMSCAEAVWSASEGTVTLHWPLLALWKPEVIALGRELAAPLADTWSCQGGGPHPCGLCRSCRLRRKADALLRPGQPGALEPGAVVRLRLGDHGDHEDAPTPAGTAVGAR